MEMAGNPNHKTGEGRSANGGAGGGLAGSSLPTARPVGKWRYGSSMVMCGRPEGNGVEGEFGGRWWPGVEAGRHPAFMWCTRRRR
jgi:hypothetical protein